MDADSGPLKVRVVSHDVARTRLGQTLLPLALLIGILARRSENMVAMWLALGLTLAVLLVFLSARRGLGRQTLQRERGKLQLVESAIELTRGSVYCWTLVGRRARLYGLERSYALRAEETDRARLEETLHAVLGEPAVLRRRGSPRARALAAVVLALGLVALGVAIALQQLAFVFVGVFAVVGGGATLGALSQRVVG